MWCALYPREVQGHLCGKVLSLGSDSNTNCRIPWIRLVLNSHSPNCEPRNGGQESGVEL